MDEEHLKKMDARLEHLEVAHAKVETMLSSHLAECGQRAKNLDERTERMEEAIDTRAKAIEGKIADLKGHIDDVKKNEPTTAYGFALRFIGDYGLAGAITLLLSGVLYWAHLERVKTIDQQLHQLQKIEKTLDQLPKGNTP